MWTLSSLCFLYYTPPEKIFVFSGGVFMHYFALCTKWNKRFGVNETKFLFLQYFLRCAIDKSKHMCYYIITGSGLHWLQEGVISLSRQFSCCPICGDEVLHEECERFGMCLDCFADSIEQNANESILFDFLREYGREFRQFIEDNYEYWWCSAHHCGGDFA